MARSLLSVQDVDYGTWYISVEERTDGTWVGVLSALGQELTTPPYTEREVAINDAYTLFKELRN